MCESGLASRQGHQKHYEAIESQIFVSFIAKKRDF